jgi:hypothetical protein
MTADRIDVRAVRRHFAFPRHGRVVTNNAASTQPPRELLALYQSLAPGYENVHRGQAVAAVAAINAGRRPATARRYRRRPARHLARSPLPVGSA